MSLQQHCDQDDPVELRYFAERILFSPHLHDKMYAPRHFSDKHPGQIITLPNSPHRSSDMQLYTSGCINTKSHIPQKRSRPNQEALNNPLKRAQLLHIFANHELLSLELMALALLRYPDAPQAFRRGLAQVIKDEQQHFLLYYHQIKILGFSWGSESVSDFFWRCVADAPTIHDFNTRLTLVFEQANIDFTRFYQPCMQQAGDQVSADILEQIYHDEIRHVKHGFHWFKKWKPTNEPEWDSFCALLHTPLSPGRAKGNVFSVEARKKIGMSPDFIQSLKLWGGSVGRPPVLWFPHFEVEDMISGHIRSVKHKKYAEQLNTSLGPMLAWVSKRGDLIYQDYPSQQFQTTLSYIRGFNPEWSKDEQHLRTRKLSGLDSWGWSPTLWKQVSTWKEQLISKAQPLPVMDSMKHLFGKIWDVKQRSGLWQHISSTSPIPLCPSIAYICYEWEYFQECAEILHQEYSYLIVKANWGSAGRHMIKIQKDQWHRQQIGWIRKKLIQGVILEPCWDRVADLSFQGSVDEQGIHYLGTMIGLVDHRGAYQGTWLSPSKKVLPSIVNRQLSANGTKPSAMRKVAQKIIYYLGDLLQKEGYVGSFGVDALLTHQASIQNAELTSLESNDLSHTTINKINSVNVNTKSTINPISTPLMLHPLVELNPRWTMGRVALQLNSLLPPCKYKICLRCVPKHRFSMPANAIKPMIDEDVAETLWWLDKKAWSFFNHKNQWIGGILAINDLEKAPSHLIYLEYIPS
jgi:uncharacterized ferritin-like protein (DUF455 family)